MLVARSSSYQAGEMKSPELSITGPCQEVPDVSGRMEDGHELEVEQRHLRLILAEQHVVDPGWEILSWKS